MFLKAHLTSTIGWPVKDELAIPAGNLVAFSMSVTIKLVLYD
jgi:hypothetical protein